MTKKRKETRRNMILPEALEDTTDYVIASIEYELRMLESLKEKEEKEKRKKQVISPISL